MDKQGLLYKYFSNQLSDKDRLHFEELLLTDSEFRAAFDYEKGLKLAIKKSQSEKLKSKLASFEKEIQSKKITRHRKSKVYSWSIAASIAILIGVSWFGYNTFSNPNYNELFDTNYEPYPNTVHLITRGEAHLSEEKKAFIAYESGHYKEAVSLFSTLDQNLNYLDLYMGISYLNIDDTEKAIELFRKAETKDHEFKEAANWYLALAYLKNNDEQRAKTVLEKQILKYEFKKIEASELLMLLQ